MRVVVCGAVLGLWILLGILTGCSRSTPPAAKVTQPTDKMPPEVIYDPESAMQKYGRQDGPN